MKRLRSWRRKGLAAVFLLILFIVALFYQYSQLDIDYYLAYQLISKDNKSAITNVYHSETPQLIVETEDDSPWTTDLVILPNEAIYASAVGQFEQGELVFHLRMARKNGRFADEASCENTAYTTSEDCYLIVPEGASE